MTDRRARGRWWAWLVVGIMSGVLLVFVPLGAWLGSWSQAWRRMTA